MLRLVDHSMQEDTGPDSRGNLKREKKRLYKLRWWIRWNLAGGFAIFRNAKACGNIVFQSVLFWSFKVVLPLDTQVVVLRNELSIRTLRISIKLFCGKDFSQYIYIYIFLIKYSRKADLKFKVCILVNKSQKIFFEQKIKIFNSTIKNWNFYYREHEATERLRSICHIKLVIDSWIWVNICWMAWKENWQINFNCFVFFYVQKNVSSFQG